MCNLSRKEIEEAFLEENSYKKMPDNYWILNGKVYLSKAEMTDEQRLQVEENEAIRLASQNQIKRFCVNEIEYDTIEQVPKKYREQLESMVLENKNREGKYRLTIEEGDSEIPFHIKVQVFISIFIVLIGFFLVEFLGKKFGF
jgi:hypothetical protein